MGNKIVYPVQCKLFFEDNNNEQIVKCKKCKIDLNLDDWNYYCSNCNSVFCNNCYVFHKIIFQNNILKFDGLHSVVEDILVSAAVDSFDAGQSADFGQNELHEAAFLHQFEAQRGLRREHNLVEFHRDALGTDNLDAFGIASDGLESVVGDTEPQLRGEADGSHHTQRVVAEGNVGVEGRAKDAFVEVAYASEGVNQLAVAVGIEADSQGVDREVAPPLVVLEGAVFDHRLATVVTITFLPGTNELQLHVAVAERGGAEGLEDRDFGAADRSRNGVGQLDTDFGDIRGWRPEVGERVLYPPTSYFRP